MGSQSSLGNLAKFMVNTRMTDELTEDERIELSIQVEMGKILGRVGRVLNGYK
jgi:predicted RNA-binding protein YlqC (UPF0109 family)